MLMKTNLIKDIKDNPAKLLRITMNMTLGSKLNDIDINIIQKLSKEIKRVPLNILKNGMDKGILFDGFIYWLWSLGILKDIIPEFIGLEEVDQSRKHHLYNVWDHTLKVIDFSPKNKIIRWAALFHDLGKKITYERCGKFHSHEIESEKLAKKILVRLRFPYEEMKDILYLVRNHMKPLLVGIYNTPTDKSINRFFRKHEQYLDNMKELAIADVKGSGVHIKSDLDKLDYFFLKLEEFQFRKEEFAMYGTEFKLSLTGKDIMNIMNIKQSPLVGKLKSFLSKKVFMRELPNNAGVLANYLKREFI